MKSRIQWKSKRCGNVFAKKRIHALNAQHDLISFQFLLLPLLLSFFSLALLTFRLSVGWTFVHVHLLCSNKKRYEWIHAYFASPNIQHQIKAKKRNSAKWITSHHWEWLSFGRRSEFGIAKAKQDMPLAICFGISATNALIKIDFQKRNNALSTRRCARISTQ